MPEENGDSGDFGSEPKLPTGKLRPRAPSHFNNETDGAEAKPTPEKITADEIQWGCSQKDVFTAIGSSTKTLEPGVYHLEADQQGRIYFVRDHLKTDELLEFKDSLANKVLKEIETFWDSKELFKKYNFLHRRGFIFYGGAGGGKTSLIQLVIKRIIERKGIVFMGNSPKLLNSGVKIFRNIEPTRHIVCIFEDIDAIINECGEEALLSFLDGENQVDDVLNIATTNYPERLDRRIICRPRRFDRRIKILPPKESIRREYFTKKLGVDANKVASFVSASEGFTFAAMADLVIQVECLGFSLEDAEAGIRALLDKKKPTGDDEFAGGNVGFT